MRQLNPDVLQERKKRILQAIIHHYIKTAKPVGSSIITQDYDFDLSPATVRNLMAELEEDGYLTHPHTSAGRIPTDKGYRSYVDSLIELQKLVIEEEDRVRQEYQGRIKEIEGVLSQTSRALSSLSHYTGFVITPKQDTNKLKYIELAHVSDNQLLIIFVTHSGLVKHKIVEASVSRERLEKLNRILNDNLKDLTLINVKQKIYEILDTFEQEQKEVLSIARSLSKHLFDIDEELLLDGTSNVLVLPEFHDYESMRCLLSLSEDKEKLLHILNESSAEKDVNVLIGSEASCKDFRQLSVISSTYKSGDHPMGILGIIGPKRMDYQRMMALVSAVSKIVNKLLSKSGG